MTTATPSRRQRTKPNLDSFLSQMIAESGYDPSLAPESYVSIARCGLQQRSLWLAIAATGLLVREKPCTLRGLFYRVVSAGVLPSTDKEHYQKLGRVMTTLREAGVVPFSWLVDNVRATQKPSSWSGIADYADTVRNAYRLSFWDRLPEYPHIIAEKDAIAGVLAPVCREYDVALSPIRGYVSLSFAHEIASTWNEITKPITAYYMGDFDPSGFDLERDVRAKLERYCTRPFSWVRLGVNEADFDEFSLIELAPKQSDRRTTTFIREHGNRCAELDAIPATELRRRVRDSILNHVPAGEWERLQMTERAERRQWTEFIDALKTTGSV
ncbi:MAG: hypothetical protein Q8K78_07110 [Planctomycetaceae bacterium]|nr:hypothetical protein [Planctomycetaceae bacterium]